MRRSCRVPGLHPRALANADLLIEASRPPTNPLDVWTAARPAVPAAANAILDHCRHPQYRDAGDTRVRVAAINNSVRRLGRQRPNPPARNVAQRHPSSCRWRRAGNRISPRALTAKLPTARVNAPLTGDWIPLSGRKQLRLPSVLSSDDARMARCVHPRGSVQLSWNVLGK
jgi:hypothetical protein